MEPQKNNSPYIERPHNIAVFVLWRGLRNRTYQWGVMVMKNLAIATLLFNLGLPGLVNADSVLNEFDAANKDFAKAILANDVDHLVSAYTDDACIIAPKTEKICGQEAIRDFWERVVASNPKDVEIITESAESGSDFAYATGQLLITDAESAVQKNRFVLVFEKVDSTWKMQIDSWTPQRD